MSHTPHESPPAPSEPDPREGAPETDRVEEARETDRVEGAPKSHPLGEARATDPLDEVRASWDGRASDWHIQVGDRGDANRILNSDPVLWDFLGPVEGLDVLDAGCGTGYLARQLRDRGARVVGVDLSENMIRIARERSPGLDLRVDSVSELATLGDGCFDRIVSNYVLMDVPLLEETLAAFFRVLRSGGSAVVVFSHPCFPQGMRTEGPDGTLYAWPSSYFERRKVVEPPWAHFTSDFLWFHRPLSDYWKAFVAAGFTVARFEEPRVTPDRYALASSVRELEASRTRPYSVAFELVKVDAHKANTSTASSRPLNR